MSAGKHSRHLCSALLPPFLSSPLPLYSLSQLLALTARGEIGTSGRNGEMPVGGVDSRETAGNKNKPEEERGTETGRSAVRSGPAVASQRNTNA